MPNSTTNYLLQKPLEEEYYNINVQNGNMDLIDQSLQGLNDSKVSIQTDKSLVLDSEIVRLGTLFNYDDSIVNQSILTHAQDTQLHTSQAQKEELQIALNQKAEKLDTYTKSEVDTKLDTKPNASDTYTKSEVDTKLDTKPSASDTYTKSEVDRGLVDKANVIDVYSKDDIDQKLEEKPSAGDTYSKSAIDKKLEVKADKLDSYLKSEVDTKLAVKADKLDGYLKSEVDTKLAVKADVTDVYTKEQTNSLTLPNPHTLTFTGSVSGSYDGSSAQTIAIIDGAPPLYDIVIRTQAEFEAMYNSPTWLDAHSVCFVGDGGSLKFTRSDGLGLLIPPTVRQIKGMNTAMIDISNFVTEKDVNMAGLWYQTCPTEGDYRIDDIHINCFTTNFNDRTYGFMNCIQMTNCISVSICGFFRCEKLFNCSGSAIGKGTTASCYAYLYCNHLINCSGMAKNGITSAGYESCHFLVNCSGIGNASLVGAMNAYGSGFRRCSHLVNCTATASGLSYGYGLYGCSYVNGCTPDTTAPQTAFLGGTNTNIDTLTVG